MAALVGGCSVLDHVTDARARRLARHGVEAGTVTLGDDTMHYWEGGDGDETIVFLHGFGGNALWQWYPQLREFADDYHVIAPDLLWFGESASRREDFSIQHQAQAVRSLLAFHGVERFHLVGLSYGGMVSHEVIGQEPAAVERVVLVASPARAFLADDKKPVLAELGVTSVTDLLLPQTPDDLRRLMRLAYHRPPWVPRWLGRQVIDEFYAPRRREHVAMLNSVEANTNVHRATYAVPPNHPTLIIWGSEDKVFPTAAALRLKAELGDNAHLCVFDEAAHAPHLERKRDVIPLMRAFLKGQRDPVRACPTISERTEA
ncbi:MAG: alpha/beta hydrolase [Nannocystaceae bacterium]